MLRDYQVYRIFGDDEESRLKLIRSLGSLYTPKLITDRQPVIVNTVIALRHLARAIRSNGSQPIDVSLLLSSFLFYIDSYSYDSTEEMAKAMRIYQTLVS